MRFTVLQWLFAFALPPLSSVNAAAADRTADAGAPCTLIGRGDLARTRGYWYEAAFRYQKAADADPADGRAWYYVGRSLATVRRYADAANAYVRAAELQYMPANAMYHAARSQARGGAPDKALASLAEAIGLGFDHFERMHHDGALSTVHDTAGWDELMPDFEPAN